MRFMKRFMFVDTSRHGISPDRTNPYPQFFINHINCQQPLLRNAMTKPTLRILSKDMAFLQTKPFSNPQHHLHTHPRSVTTVQKCHVSTHDGA